MATIAEKAMSAVPRGVHTWEHIALGDPRQVVCKLSLVPLDLHPVASLLILFYYTVLRLSSRLFEVAEVPKINK